MEKKKRLNELVEDAERISKYASLQTFALRQDQYQYTKTDWECCFTAECFRDVDIFIPVKRRMGLPSGSIKIYTHVCTDYMPSMGNPANMCGISLPFLYDRENAECVLACFIKKYYDFIKDEES